MKEIVDIVVLGLLNYCQCYLGKRLLDFIAAAFTQLSRSVQVKPIYSACSK